MYFQTSQIQWQMPKVIHHVRVCSDNWIICPNSENLDTCI